ncbi:MAG TPA: rRNA maturation RNase YbeY [Gaiellaceae bacterium]|nr:rRNA maturation RNase YbeY [Gaiellaceae bacterium]
MIAVEVENRSGAEVDADGAAALARHVLAGEGIASGELGISFVGAEESRALKREHLGIDEAADVLSFPVDGREPLPEGLPRQLGDVFVCPDVAGDEWRSALVHGLLHLVGYDHGADMTAREAEYA